MNIFNNDDDKEVKNPLGWNGYWWLPDNPDKKIPGMMIPSDDRGPSLELMGSLHTPDKEHKTVEIIHGTTPIAEYVTLYKLNEIEFSYDVRGQYRTRYVADLAVTGEHFPAVDNLIFQELQVQYSTLIRWIDMPLVNPKEIDGPSVTVRSPIKFRLFQCDKYLLEVNYSPCWNITGRGMTLSIFPTASIAMHWHAPRLIDDILPIVQSIRDFLTFATCIPTSIEGINSKPMRTNKYGLAHKMLLLHKSLIERKSNSDPFFILFTLESVKSNIEQVIRTWFQNGQKLQPVIDLRLLPIYNPQMHIESQFLSAVQSLEVFHRRMREGYDLPENEHETRMIEIFDGAPEKYRNWLKERLNHSNEIGLRKRIKRVFDEFADILQYFNLDQNDFAKVVYDTRNYLTHYNTKLEEKAAKGSELNRLINGLHLLVDICLLHECGIDRKVILDLALKRYVFFK